jgi:hypothetical protein
VFPLLCAFPVLSRRDVCVCVDDADDADDEMGIGLAKSSL